MSPVVPKMQFCNIHPKDVANPSPSRPSVEAALKITLKKLGATKSGLDRRNASVFGGDTNKNSIVFMFRIQAFLVSGNMKSFTVAVLCT